MYIHAVKTTCQIIFSKNTENCLWILYEFYAKHKKWLECVYKETELIKQFEWNKNKQLNESIHGPGYFCQLDFIIPLLDDYKHWYI